jgi:hypothetical protein
MYPGSFSTAAIGGKILDETIATVKNLLALVEM